MRLSAGNRACQICQPPEFEEYILKKPVVSCKEAAIAKGIPLKNELKTLILKTRLGFVALQLPGNAKASLRKVKNALNINQASLASPKELQLFGLEPGTVSAVQNPTWSMFHLVDETLLSLKYISTNSGSKRGYYIFKPSVLLNADNVLFGDFIQNYSIM